MGAFFDDFFAIFDDSVIEFGGDSYMRELSELSYKEYYLYSNKVWEPISSGVLMYALDSEPMQNAPIVVTASGYETTLADPWAATTGTGKWTKVGFGGFTLTSEGVIDISRNEFALHPNASGTLVFNRSIPYDLFVEYESGPSGYYIMDKIDINPIRKETDSGFVHFVSNTSVPSDMFLTASPNSIWADGYQIVRLSATLFDSNFNRLPNKRVIFEAQGIESALSPGTGYWSKNGWLEPSNGAILLTDASGASVKVDGTTNYNGEVRAIWHPYSPDASGSNITQTIKAYYADASGVFDTAGIFQTFFLTQPFTLDISLLSTADYLI
jgi:hypothetical protein